MKVLILTSSYRKSGNTAGITRLVGRQLKEIARQQNVPLDVELIYLAHQEVGMCRGCRVCFKVGEEKCPLRDDLLSIKSQIQAADALILASPVYVEDVNGVMKNWIDRMAHVCHRPEYAGKIVYLITTSGVGSSGHALRTLSTACRTWGFHQVGQASFKTGGKMPPEHMQTQYDRQIQKIAQRLFWAVHRQEAAKPSFLSLMTFKIQQIYWQQNTGITPEERVDHGYWNERGWIVKDREYYVTHTANRLKVALARFAGGLLARFVL